MSVCGEIGTELRIAGRAHPHVKQRFVAVRCAGRYLSCEEATMKIVAAATVALQLTIPLAQAADTDNWGRKGVEPAAREILAPRPGAAVRATVGAAPVPVPEVGRVIDDRVIVEERAPSVSPSRSAAGCVR
jgi:hypothetical protein